MIIDIYGLKIKYAADPPGLADDITRPFKYFRAAGDRYDIVISVEQKAPPYFKFPALESSFSTPRNIVYRDKDSKIIDYFGRGAVIEDACRKNYIIYGTDRDFLSEVFYLLILSLFGQHCDRKGLLRLHALGLSYCDKALLVMMPAAGGKSTMALSMLEARDFKVISDDAPVMDSSGRILPFPTRLGFLDRDALKAIPDEYIYAVDRIEFGTKYFVDYYYWKDRVEYRPLKNKILFIGKRRLNADPFIKKASKTKAFSFLLKQAVIGMGLYQGLEFILNNSAWEILSKIPVLFRRTVRVLQLTLGSKAYVFFLSRDVSKNAEFFKDFVNKLP